MRTLHIHLDESGDFRFGPNGSKYYVLAAAWTYDPAPLARQLQELRYGLLRDGHDVAHFHATDDLQEHRNHVVRLLRADRSWKFAAAVIEKRKVIPSLRPPERFYPQFASIPLRFILRGRVREGTERILVYTDALPVAKKKKGVEKAIRQACSAEVKPWRIPCHVYHHRSEANYWLQVADYCAWSVQRKWARDDDRTYRSLRPRLAAPELDALRHGRKVYY